MRIKEKIIKLTGLAPVPHVTAAVITLLLLSGSVLAGYISHKTRLQDERVKALGALGVIRANLEGALNSRLLLSQGLVSYISVRPDLSDIEFRTYAEKLVKSDPMIRNITVIKGTTIVFVHPLESNRKAIGVDLAKIPAQRGQILKVIETGKPIVASNVRLVQGGVATICRMPVFTGSASSARYWGQVSTVLMQDILFAEAGMHDDSRGLNCFLSSIMDDGSQGGELFGSNGMLQDEPVVLDVNFPYGKWRLAAVPVAGWGYSDNRSVIYTALLSLASLLLGWMIYWIMTLGRRVQQLESMLPVCSSCGKIRDDKGDWYSPNKYFNEKSSVKVTHGICPECTENLYGDQPWYKRRKEKQK